MSDEMSVSGRECSTRLSEVAGVIDALSDEIGAVAGEGRAAYEYELDAWSKTLDSCSQSMSVVAGRVEQLERRLEKGEEAEDGQ